ncbi:citramalate synthase [Vineibacter terrae]|uniref:citramalate synthase n=1 Tax=Vineibacter terrae TaxID=2586908 RepID=UPI002E36DA99|nr:citramalate synthase [Vineibacter terrae]HEX2885161.1 citramalate synthase [Vineibacter terrae]
MTADNRVYLFDTTLRDGAQTQGVDFSVADKTAIAIELDRIGIDYIEGGWPGANPTDDRFFAAPPAFNRARFVAFGMTRRAGRSAANDPGLNAILSTQARTVCMVGKTWDFHVDVALELGRTEYVDMIADSVAVAKTRVDEVMFDAEHFFDGYKANHDYAMTCLREALRAGARWLVLCDTNGGTLPHDIERIVAEVCAEIPGTSVGIHCHNDTENAVANSLAAVRAGARQVQGTINGLGERCGNANMIALIPSLMLKMGYDTGIPAENLAKLTHLSRLLDDRLNLVPNRSAAYVGSRAFAHKGGLHVSAVEKDPRTYEHIDPAVVGNERIIVVSDQAGRSNVVARFRQIGLEIDPKSPDVMRLLEIVKEREANGYAYDGADGSFELLARRELHTVPDYFVLQSFRVLAERRWNAKGELITLSEATVKLDVAKHRVMEVGEGNGPVNALDSALRKALLPHYAELVDMRLIDFKVRILDSAGGTAAITRVMIESADGHGQRWTTIGVSPNIIDASYNALYDAITYKLFRDGATPAV